MSTIFPTAFGVLELPNPDARRPRRGPLDVVVDRRPAKKRARQAHPTLT